MATVTEGYVKAEVKAQQSEALLRVVEAVRQSDKARFRETMWFAGLIFAMIASATGLIIAVLR